MLSNSPDTLTQPFLSTEEALINLQGDDLGLRVYAAWWLGRFRIKEPRVVFSLIAALEDNDDRTSNGGYPLRRNAARALGKLEDLCAVNPLIIALGSSDFYVREAAAQSLEMLGSSSAIPALLALLRNELASDCPASEPPNLSQPFDAILEALGTLGATDAASEILPFLAHPVERIQLSAARALYQLTDGPAAISYAERLVEALQNDSLQIRRVALTDLGAIGYLPAAIAISKTPVANSLRLISLQGLVEKKLVAHTSLPILDNESVQIMDLMDQLL